MPRKKRELTLNQAIVISILIWIFAILAALATRKYLL